VDNGEKYNRVSVLSGFSVSFFYTYNGREIKVDVDKIGGLIKATYWFNPRNGVTEKFIIPNGGVLNFNPPGEVANGNDWVLVIEKEQLRIR
jgi:hypothetical protein